MVWYGMVWYGMVWYGMVWYDIMWQRMYGMVWSVNRKQFQTKTKFQTMTTAINWHRAVNPQLGAGHFVIS